ncbi:MAG: spore maturation protein [Roseburia sp.]|nr:spore maturation protein [Roseburia sp.]
MNFLFFISETIIPILIFWIVAYGVTNRQPVYEDFVVGAKEGFKTVLGILPTLIGLMVAVGVLRASGFLDFLTTLLAYIVPDRIFPTELIPLSLVKMFSSSASTGLLVDIFKEYGADSELGKMAAVMMSSTETIFYTLSVYFMSIKIKKMRYTAAGALVATIAGLWASVYFTQFI